ncbi:MAG: lactate utilization protein B [Solirubrobacterales bacterium]
MSLDATQFPGAAAQQLGRIQMRRNVAGATDAIRAKRAGVVAELPDWEDLREAGRAIKESTLEHLDEHLIELERSVLAAGGVVHWASDAAAANRIVIDIVRGTGAREAIKVKSMTTAEIGLNEALAGAGIDAIETDLAELIVQLGDDLPSHIVVPAIHRNRKEIRDLFAGTIADDSLGDEPSELVAAARAHLRRKFSEATVAISGANFAVAETGAVGVVESEGNGRMCVTLPRTLVTVMGIEKVLPRWRDLEVFLQLLPRSSTGERMNPYTSVWSGTRGGDGPERFHLVLLDNGRTDVLADLPSRQTLACIRCSACLNACPVYRQVGGHAYDSVYPGPIGAILTPQLQGLEEAGTLPFASSLCGACYEVCPVKIDIPSVLVHLRGRSVEAKGGLDAEGVAMRALARAFRSRRGYERAQRVGRTLGRPLSIAPGLKFTGPLARWTTARELPDLPDSTFREWWRTREARER